MTNWHDPIVIYKDFLALIKLGHAVGGLYIWETVLSMGFELDVLRGKRPYRWTIWLYLGTRYTALLGFILYFIDKDSSRVPCQPFMVADFALPYASWAFASLIIVLRVIAVWDRNIFVSLLALGLWLVGLALNIYSLAMMKGTYLPTLGSCITLHLRRCLVNAVATLVADIILLITMLIGLLRHAHRSSTGIWSLLYQQCIMWIALAALAEVPIVVFLILDLNDAWNIMFGEVAIAVLSISAARMYRSLCQYGSFTEYVSTERPKVPPGTPMSYPENRITNVSGRIRFAAATQSNGTGTTSEAPVSMPADHVQSEFAPSVLNPKLVYEDTKEKVRYEMA